MTDTSPATPRRLRHWLLVTSLVLNVFLIGGIAAGLAVRHGSPFFGHDRPSRMMAMPTPHKIRAALPESAQPVIEGIFDAHRQDMRSRIGRLRDARRAVAAAIRAEPFDPAVLGAALAELRAREGEVASAAHEAVAELAAKLDPDSRARLAELVEIRRRGDQQRPAE